MIQTRNMQATDAAAVNRLSEQLGYPQTLADTTAYIQSVLDSNDDCAFVALDAANQVCGWIHGFKTRRIESAAFTEIGGLVVDSNNRGQGAGRILVQAVHAWCLEQGIHILKVRSNVIRDGAHRFYLGLGFHEKKEQKVFEISI
ncbi:hypothetical protein B0I18_11293 [Taibaiella chishuiensis]|uniref:N-acetyltransferase domain-containing protein n=2 Tax=Taibaiella chishuiensis TaxID=1434707 RepID=A0A2P8CWD4_9BACT|nr:hypothetical protein B0I18_11293 [Taibaiella chishuiensis]